MGETDEELHDLALRIRDMLEAQKANAGPFDWVTPQVTSVVLGVIGGIFVLYSNLSDMRTQIEVARSRQVTVLEEVAALKSWRDTTQGNRFTASDGAALKQSLEQYNTVQDQRIVGLSEALQARVGEINARIIAWGDRMFILERRISKIDRGGDPYDLPPRSTTNR